MTVNRRRVAAYSPDPTRTAASAVAVVLVLGVAAVGGAVSALGGGPTVAAVREFVAGFGPLAPLAFVGLQALQVVVAPVPGGVLAGAGGYLFGGLGGTVLSMTGVVLGSLVVFGLTRTYGRAAVEGLLGGGGPRFERFERFGETNGPLALFVFFLVPLFPDDLLCAVAGLWDVRLRTFLVLLVVGRTPSFVAVSYAGTSLQSGALAEFGLLVGVLAVACLGAFVWRDRIEGRLRAGDTARDASDR